MRGAAALLVLVLVLLLSVRCCATLASHPPLWLPAPSVVSSSPAADPPAPSITVFQQTAKECGLHSGNVKKGGEDDAAGAAAAARDLWADASAVEALDRAGAEALAAGQRDKDTLLVLYAPWCQFCQVG